jgi:hypothetical protein
MKKVVLCILLIFQFNAIALDQFVLREFDKKIQNLSSVKNIFRKYKKKLLVSNLRNFVSCCRPTRMVGSKGHDKTAKWLFDRIKKIESSSNVIIDEFTPDIDHAIALYREDFQREIAGNYSKSSPVYKKWNNFTNSMINHLGKLRSVKGQNVIWEKKGTINPEEVLILGAHYDTIAFNKENLTIDFKSEQPGADNNGSGVSALLSLIEVLSEVDLPKTVRIVFFDYQEFGFLGARAYVKKYLPTLKKEKFAGFINVLMLGHDTKSNDKKKKLNNFKIYIRKESDSLHGKDLKLVNSLKKTGDKSLSGIRFEIEANSFNSGDHVNFWEAGLAACTFSQNWEDDFNIKNHHTSNDFVETLNFKSLYNSFRYLGVSVLAWSYDII